MIDVSRCRSEIRTLNRASHGGILVAGKCNEAFRCPLKICPAHRGLLLRPAELRLGEPAEILISLSALHQHGQHVAIFKRQLRADDGLQVGLYRSERTVAPHTRHPDRRGPSHGARSPRHAPRCARESWRRAGC